MTAWMCVKNQMRCYHIIFLKAKLWNSGKDFSPFFFKVTKANAYILYALSHVEGTTKVSPRKLKKTLIDKLIDYLIDIMFFWKVWRKMVFGCLSKKHDRNSVVVDKPIKRKHTNLIYTDCFDKNIFIQNITSIFIILNRFNTW